MHFLKVDRGLGHDNFQGRPNVGFGQMASKCTSVSAPEHDVNVQSWLPRRRQGNIADQRGNFDLFMHRN